MDLALLAEALDEPPTTVAEVDGEYRLSHEPLNEIEDAAAARAELERMAVRLQALARLRWGRDMGDIRASVLVGLDQDGHRTQYIAAGPVNVRVRVLPVRMMVTGSDGEVISPSPDPMPGELQLALDDDSVDEALYFLQRPAPSWSELYKVYEVVRDDVKRKRIISNGWATHRELRRLTGTANHPALAGRDARHARQSTPPMTDPMSLADAQELVGRIVRAWIASKVEPTRLP
jgi:hypothetical protein